ATSQVTGNGTVRVTVALATNAGTTTTLALHDALPISSGPGGTLNGAGDLVVNGTLTWPSGVMGGSGTTTIGTSGTLNFGGASSSGDVLSDERHPHNHGAATFGLGGLTFGGSAAIVNAG